MNRAQRSDHPELRESYLLYRKYSGYSRTVEEYEKSHKQMCSNCHRVVHDEHENNDAYEDYRIVLVQKLSNTVKSKKFKLIESV